MAAPRPRLRAGTSPPLHHPSFPGRARSTIASFAGPLLALLLAACSGPEPALVTQVDLIEAFRDTEAGCARERLDLGTPDGDRARIGGWISGPPARDSVVWVAERRADLRLCLGEPGERRLRIRAQAGPVHSTRRRTARAPVAVRLNRQRVGTIRVGEEIETFELALPRRAQRRGDNLLELEHPMLGVLGRTRSATLPEGSVGYDWLEVVDAGGSARGSHRDRASTVQDTLLIPAGEQVSYFLRTPAHARLRFALAPGSGGDPGALRVAATRADGVKQTLLDLAAPSSGPEVLEVALDSAPGDVLELSLEAHGASEVRLRAPALVGSATAPASDASAARPAPARPTNVLLYVIDTLRADHLGCYGYALPTSPRIDALAREGVVFDRVVAQSSWTRPAVASMLTGLAPHEHGAIGLRQQLDGQVPTLAELLAAAGYATAAFVTNVNVSAPFGLARGFENFVYLPEDPSRDAWHVLSDELGREAKHWLAARDERPFFLYVHASDPHAPYTAAPELRARFRRASTAEAAIDPAALRAKMDRDASSLTAAELSEVVVAYDAEIAFNDANLGALLDELDRLGLRDSTLVVVTADHGEEFRDHGGFQHGHTLYEELIRVPLVVRLPGGERAGERSPALARQIDLLPTILDRLGVTAPPGLSGRALLGRRHRPGGPSGAADEDPPGLEAFSHTRLATRDITALVTDSWKVIRHLGGTRGAQVFDLAADPSERHDVAAERSVLAGYALQAMRRASNATTGRGSHGAVPIDADTERRLRALGYTE